MKGRTAIRGIASAKGIRIETKVMMGRAHFGERMRALLSYVVLLVISLCACTGNGDTVRKSLLQLSRATGEQERVEIIARELWDVNDPRIERDFIKRLSAERTQEAYYVAQYLAKRGNLEALKILSENGAGYPISSWQWSYTLREFGRHHYEPAIPTLIDNLDAACLNVVDEACAALRLFYPDAPRSFSSQADVTAYFEMRYRTGH
jgi:hypothetical protein